VVALAADVGHGWRERAATTRAPAAPWSYSAGAAPRRRGRRVWRPRGAAGPEKWPGACSTGKAAVAFTRAARGAAGRWPSWVPPPEPARLAEGDPGCAENIRPTRRRRGAGVRRERTGVRRPPVRGDLVDLRPVARRRPPLPRERRWRFSVRYGTSWRRIGEI